MDPIIDKDTRHPEADAEAEHLPDQGQGDVAGDEAAGAAELEAALTVIKQGDIVTGRVVQVSPDSVMVDVGYKSEGIITLNELSHRPIASADEAIRPGDEIRVMVTNLEGPEGTLRLSRRRAEEVEAWQRIEDWNNGAQIVEAQVTEAVKGGLVVDLGLRAFLPASQVERGYVADLGKYVGQIIRVKIIETDKHKRRVILSRKKVLEEERERARSAFWESVAEGQIRTGIVKSLTDFGAFIDLGGVDGLLHVSEMSYGRVKHPSEVLHDGKEVQVKIIRLDPEKGKVSLSLKQALPDPWTDVAQRYVEGSVVEGRVARLATFGAFIELEPGIDGLVHISQLADYRVVKPDDVVAVGQMVRARVIQVRPEERRISLSLREVDQPEAAIPSAEEEGEPANAPDVTAETDAAVAVAPEVAESAPEGAADPGAPREAEPEAPPEAEPEAIPEAGAEHEVEAGAEPEAEADAEKS